MATVKKTSAASITRRQHLLAQPEGRRREKPGTTGRGKYYRVVVRPKDEFVTFRYHDVGEKDGDLQRLAGKRQSGSWDTQAWLINKKSAHIEGDKLIADSYDVSELLDTLGSEPKHVEGDIFEAKDRLNIPEYAKPTAAQKRARIENIEKAQEAHWLGTAGGKASHKK